MVPRNTVAFYCCSCKCDSSRLSCGRGFTHQVPASYPVDFFRPLASQPLWDCSCSRDRDKLLILGVVYPQNGNAVCPPTRLKGRYTHNTHYAPTVLRELRTAHQVTASYPIYASTTAVKIVEGLRGRHRRDLTRDLHPPPARTQQQRRSARL